MCLYEVQPFKLGHVSQDKGEGTLECVHWTVFVQGVLFSPTLGRTPMIY